MATEIADYLTMRNSARAVDRVNIRTNSANPVQTFVGVGHISVWPRASVRHERIDSPSTAPSQDQMACVLGFVCAAARPTLGNLGGLCSWSFACPKKADPLLALHHVDLQRAS
jgi:hypothetical protein